jgi:hypothetical protein
MTNNMIHVDQDDFNENEIDDISYTSYFDKAESIDPFLEIRISSLPPKMKRKAQRLQKQHVGQDGTKSKYIDPEVINGYSLWDIVNPPYDLDNLSKLYDQSAIHYAAINARVIPPSPNNGSCMARLLNRW